MAEHTYVNSNPLGETQLIDDQASPWHFVVRNMMEAEHPRQMAYRRAWIDNFFFDEALMAHDGLSKYFSWLLSQVSQKPLFDCSPGGERSIKLRQISEARRQFLEATQLTATDVSAPDAPPLPSQDPPTAPPLPAGRPPKDKGVGKKSTKVSQTVAKTPEFM